MLPQRLKLVLCIIAVIGLMGAVGCENKPAPQATPAASAGKLPTPPPQLQIGPPGQNARPPAR